MCKNTNLNKIIKFDSFLLESKMAQLLLEGNLMASSKFLNKLSLINNNKIATALYNAFSDKKFIDKDLPQNWVDVTDTEDTVSFMPDRGASRLNNNPEEVFASKSRNQVKVGRFARAILGELGIQVTDRDIENFVNIYKAAKTDTSKKFELVTGLSIKKYYYFNNYAKRTGSLGGSCMQHEDCQRFFKIYSKNPDQCQLLVYLDENGKVLGRALVWKIYKTDLYNYPDGKPFENDIQYFMDRVYTANDSDIIKFVNYAKEHGWLYKYKMTSDDRLGLFFKYGDKIVYGRLIVQLQRLHFSKYPYVDTLTFTDGDSKISNVGFTVDDDNEDADEGFIMRDTDGGHDSCSECGGSGYEEHRGDECIKCDGDGVLNCPNCGGTSKAICKDCDGDGNLICSKCEGDGYYPCGNCNGDGYLNCRDCQGDGYKECSTCHGDGDLGGCEKCKGDGQLECPTCKDEETTCRTCKGSGQIIRKWGTGTRRVACPDCRGAGKGRMGETGREGCRCETCSQQWGRQWSNTGTVNCDKCEGEGVKICPTCKDEDDPGKIQCRTCDGRGGENCEECNHGSIECEKCNGKGSVEICKTCKGEGNLGKCDKCEDGEVTCEECSGTGKRPKYSKKPLCPECSGILDEVNKEIKSGKSPIGKIF